MFIAVYQYMIALPPIWENDQLRCSVDARAQHHDEPYTADVPGGIGNVGPGANRIENVGEILGNGFQIAFFISNLWDVASQKHQSVNLCCSFYRKAINPQNRVEQVQRCSKVERLRCSGQGTENSEPKASRIPAVKKENPRICCTGHTAPGTCTWMELSPHAARLSAASSSDRPPRARTACASWETNQTETNDKSSMSLIKSHTCSNSMAKLRWHDMRSWLDLHIKHEDLVLLRIWFDQAHGHKRVCLLYFRQVNASCIDRTYQQNE